MGYRNLLHSAVEIVGGKVYVQVAGAAITGTPMEPIDSRAVVAIRPEDLHPAPDGPISAAVEIAEYHGRDFYAVATAPDGSDLYFRSPVRISAGETVRLTAAPDRVLIYAAERRA